MEARSLSELVAYRLASHDTPLWVHPNGRPGRFNWANAGPTQYLCLHPLGPSAEYLRGQNLRSAADLGDLRLRIWVLRVVVEDVTELGFDAAPEHGLDPFDLVGDDHAPCRDFGDRVRADPTSPTVFAVPSASLPGTSNLVIFGPRVMMPYLADPIDEVDVPAAVVAEGARPLHALLARVRFPGRAHAEYESWRRGEPFTFDQPGPSVPGDQVPST